MIKNIFAIGFNKYRNCTDEIDYLGLAIHLCTDGDIVFRWGYSSGEAEIALVFSRDVLTIHNN